MLWKSLLLLVTTLGFIPVILAQDSWAATWYTGALIAIHVAGLVVFAWGMRKDDLGATTQGLTVRLVFLLVLVVLLYLASQGLQGRAGVVFWLALAATWFLHTAGLAIVYVRKRDLHSVCPFAR